MSDLDARVELNRLLDFYGPLLTENRREIMRLYCEEDLSLAEIAEQLGITRQGVSDALNKARMKLEDYENKLRLLSRYRELGREAQRAQELLSGLSVAESDRDRLASAREALENILQKR